MVVAVAMKTWLKCTGNYKGGLCGKKLAHLDVEDFRGVVTIRCSRCKTVVEFR